MDEYTLLHFVSEDDDSGREYIVFLDSEEDPEYYRKGGYKLRTRGQCMVGREFALPIGDTMDRQI